MRRKQIITETQEEEFLIVIDKKVLINHDAEMKDQNAAKQNYDQLMTTEDGNKIE